MKRYFGSFILAALGAFLGAAVFYNFFQEESQPIKTVYLPPETVQPTFSRLLKRSATTPSALPDFVDASSISRPAVVHVESRLGDRSSMGYDLLPNLRDFFRDNDDHEGRVPRGRASGSGVIISPDGYIATNNHVIEDADRIVVTLIDNRQYEAKLIGTDITTDLALLKVATDEELPFLEFGDSDNVNVGEWVLAVGNPLNLSSTVTAGIVSAKGRNLELLSRDTDYAIESFIQTDAVVNRGNSGGALVSLKGELIGINTAISSQNGYFQGYSFAIPASIARKVMEDLLMFGEVRRGLLGVSINPINASMAEKLRLSVLKGAFVERVNKNSGAFEAGLERGDVIVSVNEVPVSSPSELQEQISRYRPGDHVKVQAYRGETQMLFDVMLKSLDESVGDILNQSLVYKGNEFRLLSPTERIDLEQNYGVMVIQAAGNLSRVGIEEGFVITEVNGTKIRSLDQLEAAFQEAEDFVTVKGLYHKGKEESFEFSW